MKLHETTILQIAHQWEAQVLNGLVTCYCCTYPKSATVHLGLTFHVEPTVFLGHTPGPPGRFSKPKRPGRLGSWMRRDHAKTDLAVRNFALPFAVGIACQLGDGNIIRSMVLGPNQATEKISRYEMSQRASAETAREFVHIQRWQCAIQSCWHCLPWFHARKHRKLFCMLFDNKWLFFYQKAKVLDMENLLSITRAMLTC